MLELIVPFSINVTTFAKSSALKGIFSGSSSFSFNILEISEIIQLLTAFLFPHILLASSNKSDKYFELVIIFASLSANPYS